MAKLLPLDTVLKGRYRIQSLIGHGGIGAVYLSEDLRLRGRLCAIKEVLPELMGPLDVKEAQEQFYQEASVLARLDHPNLPKVSDYFSEGGREYLVMDFVPGKDLRTILLEHKERGKLLDEETVLGWARQLCDALEYLHGQDPPVLHRDIKPSNIKLTPSGLIKLVDFGLVKLLSDEDEEHTITVVQGRGTLQYTPLEQYGGDTGHTDARSDIYALGATLYHLLTGVPPTDAKERFLRPGSLPLPRSLNPRISERTEQAILESMAMHPDNRPQNIAELRELLFGEPSPSRGAFSATHGTEWDALYRAVLDNSILAVAAAVAVAAAILATLYAPPLP